MTRRPSETIMNHTFCLIANNDDKLDVRIKKTGLPVSFGDLPNEICCYEVEITHG